MRNRGNEFVKGLVVGWYRIANVEELFRARLENKESLHTQTNTKLLPSLSELQQRIEVSNQWFFEFVQNIEKRYF